MSKLEVALLGPEYTFSDKVSDTVGVKWSKKHYCHSISSIFTALDKDPNLLGLVPLENLFNGPVTSSYDGLTRSILNGNSKLSDDNIEIFHTVNLSIELCIGRKKNASYVLSEVEEVYSHEQAIGQSEKFILENCPSARLIPTESTSQAVHFASNSQNKAMAIASPEALISKNFEIIGHTTPTEQVNQTRFAFIGKRSKKEEFLAQLSKDFDQFATFVCLDPGMDRQGLLLEILNILSSKHGLNLFSIYSRPDHSGGFLFYFEIEGAYHDKQVKDALVDLEIYCREQTGEAAKVYVFGSYLRQSFSENKINAVSVIGSEGAMGRWLCQFFSSKGIKVFKYDKQRDLDRKEDIKNSEIIFFSVPIQNVEESIKDYLPYIAPGSLVVDNSSVKTKVNALFESYLPKEIEFASIHTMFGPTEESLKGRNVIFTRQKGSGELTKLLKRMFYKFGAIISEVSVKEHDTLVAYTQAIVHFISLGFSDVLKKEHVGLDSLKTFLTPNSERLLINMQRTLSQSNDLNQAIIGENIYSKHVREMLLESLSRLDKSIDSNNLKDYLK